MPLYSAYRFDPYGSAALEKFLQASGQKVTLLTHPILPGNAKGVLVNITPPYQSGMLENYSTGQHYNPQLLRWIAAGNTLIDSTQNATGLTDHFHLRVDGLVSAPRSDRLKHQGNPEKEEKIKRGEHQRKQRHIRLRMPGVLPGWLTMMQKGDSPDKLRRWIHNVPWKDASAVDVNLPSSRRRLELLAPAYLIIPKKDHQWQVLAKIGSRPVAIERPLGKGRVIVIGSPWPLLNGGIGHAGNLDLLRAIIGNQPVILDQWSLGVGHNYTILDILRRYGLMPALVQLIVLLIVYAWSYRGYPVIKWNVSRSMARSSLEHIAMLGRLYESALSDAEICQRVSQEVSHRMALALRCSPDQIGEKIKKQPDTVGQASRLFIDRLQTVERNIPKHPGGVQRHDAARHRALAEIMTQSWQLAKEISHGGHSGVQAAADHRSAGRGPRGNKKGDPRAGITD